jgi:hypothetical protein
VALERDPLSLVRIIAELFVKKISRSGLEERDERLWGSVALTTPHSLTAKVGTASPTTAVAQSAYLPHRLKATEFVCF